MSCVSENSISPGRPMEGAKSVNRPSGEAASGDFPHATGAVMEPDAMLPSFSLLMAVYQGDHLSYLRRAIESGTVGQRLPPSQLVIVRDGPVSAGIDAYLNVLPRTLIESFRACGRPADAPEVVVVPLERNHGLAYALNVGLAHCSHGIVARADSDDISLPERFATMLPLFAGPDAPDAAGSAIREFTDDERQPGLVRTLPQGGERLGRFARLQSPLHHPSIVFRKDSVLAAGGYPEGAGRFEDYLLWERMLLRGACLRNVPEALVLYRIDAGAYRRRGGMEMFREELRLQRRFREDGFTTWSQYVRNVVVRACYRLVPESARRGAYRVLVALHNRHA